MSTTRRLARTIIAAAGCLAALPALASDPPVTDATTLATLDKVTTGDWRSPENRARDIWRHPKETLQFFGLKPGRGRKSKTIVSSTLGSVTSGFAHYMSSKAGIVGFTRAISTDLAPYGITVNAISPTLTRSPGTLARAPRAQFKTMDEEFEAVAQTQAIKKVAVPDDIVGTVSFLTSDDAAFITGQTINVDGGRVRT